VTEKDGHSWIKKPNEHIQRVVGKDITGRVAFVNGEKRLEKNVDLGASSSQKQEEQLREVGEDDSIRGDPLHLLTGPTATVPTATKAEVTQPRANALPRANAPGFDIRVYPPTVARAEAKAKEAKAKAQAPQRVDRTREERKDKAELKEGAQERGVKPKQELENKVQKFKREQARKQDEQKETIAELTRRIKELEQEQAWAATGKQRQADKEGQDKKDARIAELEKEKEQDRARIAELEKEVEQERGEKEEVTRFVNELMTGEDETKETKEKDTTE
jgi:DNA repair exonuclease SbcCD ATPase subunit